MTAISPRASLLLVGVFSLAIEGCKGCASEEGELGQLVAIDGTASGVWVGDGLGVGETTVPVLTTNALGAAVGDVDVQISADAPVDPSSETVAADGWSSATVTAARGLWPVTATLANGVEAVGHAWSVGAGPGSFEYPAWPSGGEPTGAALAGGGAAWVVGDTIWWSRGDDSPPVRVAELPDEVRALVPVVVDGDGVGDALAWSDTTVVLLRGRDSGGLSWGGGWTVSGATIGGATVGNPGGDAYADLVVAFGEGDVGRVEVYEGDGVWGFAFADVLPDLPFFPYGVSVEDVDADGEIELTVLTVDGLLRRFARLNDQWASTSVSSEYDVGVGPGAVLWPAMDMNDDGIEDVIATGPLLTGEGWQASVATVGGDSHVVYHMFSGEGIYAPPASLGVGIGDMTGDGVPDLALSAPDGVLHRAAWYLDEDDDAPSFHIQSFTVMPSGAAAVGDFDEDGFPDVFVAGEVATIVLGEQVPDDATTAAYDPVLWRPRTPETAVFGLRAVSPPWIGDLDGDGLVDVVAMQRGEAVEPDVGWTDELFIAGWRGQVADTGPWLRSGGSVSLAVTDGEPLDMAICGMRAYALVSAMGATALHRFDLSATAGLIEDGPPQAIDATHIACGDFGDYEVVGFSEEGDNTWIMPDGTAVAGTAYGDGVFDVVAHDPEGDGLDTALVCSEEGCVVAAGDLDADGLEDSVVQSASSGLEVTLGGVPYALDDVGVPSVWDTDGDGVDDLVLGAPSAVVVHQGAPGGLTPGVGRYVWRPTEGPVAFGDMNGDGAPDAFFLGVDFSDVETPVWEGTVVLAPAIVQ